ncbi:GntR family transcriptional regulator [Lacicoccus qingdaonensis]|uniref:DNA-binding transcriptional regulator, GntR family n=1 Tax=Lacicoccus qingdaonensis TaxID=576118 RepID=A0A1G9G427_9BACL|nr:GntR family transcriptional regulator [Salinicoccus qingdaonensis]SDK95377.1 DNA-binding transcriptional regulator, GntR family [Salinicoccus qingdaonensis]
MKTIQTKVSLSEQAFHILKEEIATGKLKVGDALPEEKISAQLGISRTPLRDALAKLENEGLIRTRSGKPSVVSGFSKEDSLNHMEMRRILEVENLERIIHKMDEGNLESLNENIYRQERAVKDGRHQLYLELDSEFHMLLTESNDNRLFREMITRLSTGVDRAFLTLSNTIEVSLEDALTEHKEILDALTVKDLSLAKEALLQHLNNVEERFLKFYDKGENTYE